MAVDNRCKEISRRDFMKTAGALALGAGMGANLILPGSACASKKELKILQWAHTDSDFRWWFSKYCEEWGKKNDTDVYVKLGSA